jgi:glycosyltransferase involved in cell wall biosynthesis
MASRFAAKRCDGVVAVAEHLLKALPRGIPSNQVQIIPCGIDLDLFQPIDHSICLEKLGWEKGNFHILFQNSGDPVKRPELAYAAVERLKSFGVKAELHELRNVPYEQVPVWLNASDVLLVTSYHEGSPTIVKEALACNLPIVSVAVGDVPQRIRGIEGCHISSSNAIDLAEKLHRVRMNTTRIDGRGAVQQISVDNSAAKLCQFYNLVLKGQNTKPRFA